MKRLPFILKLNAQEKQRTLESFQARQSDILTALGALGARNVSCWAMAEFVLCYAEYPDETDAGQLKQAIRAAFDGLGELFAAPGTLPLMYHDIGIVREDKSLIRHRVFATRLKPGCAEEYKRRHDALVAARGDRVTQGPESNFTIWNANGVIFGYCELVRAYDHPMSDEERKNTIAWETRQLEIMDWITDDVDWMTGERHEAVRRII